MPESLPFLFHVFLESLDIDQLCPDNAPNTYLFNYGSSVSIENGKASYAINYNGPEAGYEKTINCDVPTTIEVAVLQLITAGFFDEGTTLEENMPWIKEAYREEFYSGRHSLPGRHGIAQVLIHGKNGQ